MIFRFCNLLRSREIIVEFIFIYGKIYRHLFMTCNSIFFCIVFMFLCNLYPGFTRHFTAISVQFKHFIACLLVFVSFRVKALKIVSKQSETV